jgi:psiF repeat-containing protein
MTSLKITSALAACFLLVAGAAANATESTSPAAPPQGWTTPNVKTAADSTTTTPPATAKPRTAASIECSKEADAKGLHGKERKAFRASCKSAIKAGKPVPEKS